MFARLFAHRRYLAPLALVVTVTFVLAANPVWATAAGLDVWNVPALQQEIADAEEYGRALAATDEEVQRRIEVKEQLVATLIAGRATLAETTAVFQALNQSSPECLNAVRGCYAGSTDEEKQARNVIDFTLRRLKGESPARQAQIRSRLDAELTALIDGPTSATR